MKDGTGNKELDLVYANFLCLLFIVVFLFLQTYLHKWTSYFICVVMSAQTWKECDAALFIWITITYFACELSCTDYFRFCFWFSLTFILNCFIAFFVPLCTNTFCIIMCLLDIIIIFTLFICIIYSRKIPLRLYFLFCANV